MGGRQRRQVGTMPNSPFPWTVRFRQVLSKSRFLRDLNLGVVFIPEIGKNILPEYLILTPFLRRFALGVV
jgi:hypothetical protein